MISASVAPDFLRMLVGLPLDVLYTRTSRCSVNVCGLPSLALAPSSGRLPAAMSSRRPRISWLCSPIKGSIVRGMRSGKNCLILESVSASTHDIGMKMHNIQWVVLY